MGYPKPLDVDPIVTVQINLHLTERMPRSEAKKRGLRIIRDTPPVTTIRRPYRSGAKKRREGI